VYDLTQTNEAFPKINFKYSEDKFSSYSPDQDNKRLHEAGSIAFKIGKVFLSYCHLISDQ